MWLLPIVYFLWRMVIKSFVHLEKIVLFLNWVAIFH
jgi:hypothetical protein